MTEPLLDALVVIPVYNARSWCESLEVHPGLRYLASDNASTDGSAEALLAKGVTVISKRENVGRIGNWRACIESFLKTDAVWLKWLFTGDSLSPDALSKVSGEVQRFPSARMISTGIRNVERPFHLDGPALFEPAQATRRAAEHGNWFGPPSAVWIHREALEDGYEFGQMQFLADMQLFLDVARRFPVLALPNELAEFNLEARQFHRAHSETQLARLEHAVMRHQAARHFLEITGDKAEFERLTEQIERDTEFSILERAGLSSKDLSELEHVLKLIPASRLPSLTLRRFLSGLRKSVRGSRAAG